ncbi:hydrogenase 4 subunit B [Rhodoplanes roseus]|uniref:Hydrogenase 4 subunit B n=1 Tax=Rhodoplanes roseus TaxID=29409 RepID=A0A327L597_9BRAD|nr:hydrogenase 4 subunit B [Rhodoplanes roseus]RAI46119.1 hydrogenase 4 subunit B [Rhodoplanes roseus]
MPEVAIGLWCIAGFLGTGVLAVVLGGRAIATPLVYGTTLVIALAALLLALDVLLGGRPATATVLPIGLPGLGAHFRLDSLSAFFMLVVNFGAAASSLYAIGYGRHEHAPMRVLPFFGPFLAGMNLVLLAADGFSFLLSWEFMSLASWTLVVSHHQVAANIRAGFTYLAMASFGTLCLLLALGLLAAAGGEFTFERMRTATVSESVAATATLLALIGAGSKAGLVPLHVWLPLAHPAAPSHVSALLSGVMTKVGIYGFIRIVFDVVGDFSPWAGLVVVVAGGATAALGVLYAVMQRDLKRLLAYSTVENIGIVFIGLGLALAFRANGQGPAAALALTAALFHVFNHSVFKSLLFFGAGAVLSATGERDMEKLGGLVHRMPQTAVVFLIGCMSIAALPPLNGFVSEWMTFQAILLSPQLPQWGLKFAVPAVGAMLALAAALAGACFVKAFGVVFLSRPRSSAAATAVEVDGFSLTAMLLLAWVCVLAGTLPGFVIDALSPVARELTWSALPAQAGLPWLSIVPIAESRSSYNGLVIFFFLVVSGVMTAVVVHRLASRSTRTSPIWDCGYPLDSPVTQYTSSSFAMPIRRVFGTVLFAVHETVDMPRPGEMRAARFRMRVRDPAWRFLYGPLVRWIMRSAQRLNRLQFLTIRRYLALVFAALIVLMLVVAIWR